MGDHSCGMVFTRVVKQPINTTTSWSPSVAVHPSPHPPCRDTVKQAASAHAGQPVNWVVVDVAQQPSFRRAYGFSADQLPALLALSTKRMRFAQVGSLAACKLIASKRLSTACHLQHWMTPY